MKTVLHAGPILLTEGGKFAFTTHCPAEGGVTTHTYDKRSQAATDRGAMRRGIEMAGGSFVSHAERRTFDRIVKGTQP